MVRFPVIILFLLLVIQCNLASAQNVRIKLENCKIDQATYNEIRNALNFQLSFYARIFNAPPAREFQARIFRTKAEWVEFSKNNINYNPLKRNAAAYYSPEMKEMILHLEVTDFAKIFAHELSQALHYYYAGKYMAERQAEWIHEGVATLLEDMVVTDSTYYLGERATTRWRRLNSLYEKAMSLERVYDQVENFEDYILAWWAAYYLYRINKDVLYNIIRSEVSTSGRRFDALYPGGLDQLNIDSRSFFLNAVP